MAKKKNSIIKTFTERYTCHEHDGGYLLYDKEGESQRATALFKGKFYVSTDGKQFSFNDNYYKTVEELVTAMDEWAKTLPFNVEIYNPIFRSNYKIECAIHDYLKSLGFDMSWKHNTDAYILKDNYGKDICTFIVEVEEDTTKGNIRHYVATDRWVETPFNDLDSAIGACNMMLVSYCGVMNAQLTKLLSSLTSSRVGIMMDNTFNMRKLTLTTEDAKQKTIKWLEEELERLKNV